MSRRAISPVTIVLSLVYVALVCLAAGCTEDRPVVQPPGQGACCTPAGICTVTTQTACTPPNTWEGEGTTCSPNPCPEPPDDDFMEVEGSVLDLPVGLPFGNLKVYAGKDSFLVGTNGKVNLQVSKKAGQTVLLGDPQGKLVHVTLFPADPTKQVEIGAKETALSLVLLNPFLSTNKKEVLEQARALVLANPKFPALETTLRGKIQGGYRLGDDDPAVKLALGDVYKDLFADLGHRYLALGLDKSDPPTVNGLTLQTVAVDGTKWTFRVGNAFKRWVRIYGQTHSAAGFSDPQPLGLVPSPQFSILEIVLTGGSITPAQSAVLELPTGTNDFARIGCYGLGAGSGLPQSEMPRLLQPMLVSTVLDFGFPMISALSGQSLSDFTVSGAIEGHPAYPIVNLMLQDTPGLEADLLAAMREQDTPKVFDLLSSSFLKTLSDNPGPWATSVKGILDRVPNGKAVAPRAVKGFVGPVKCIQQGLQSADLTWAFVGRLSADAVTVFRYDFQAAPDFPVRLQGQVKNAAGNVAIAGASVSIVDDDQTPVVTVVSDAQGNFVSKVPRDTLDLTISKGGFFTARQRVIIPSDVTNYQLPTTLLASYSDSAGTIGGKVIDAASGQGLPAVQVKLVRGFDPSGTDLFGEVQTNEQGLYQFASVPPGNYTAVAVKTGFLDGWINLASVGGVTRTDFDIILTVPLGEGFRFVLSWGERPSDLDSHLATPLIEGSVYQVLWSSRGSLTQAPYAQLDVDDTSAYGPETVTIGRSFDGTYRYAIYQYSSDAAITASNARVVLYNGNAIVRQWAVPTEGTGRWWYVCDLDAVQGRVTEYNLIQEAAPEGMTTGKAGSKGK